MTQILTIGESSPVASHGRKLDAIPTGRLLAGVPAPFLMVPHTGSPVIFFGTILVVVSIGALIPLLFARETVGQVEEITEAVPEPA